MTTIEDLPGRIECEGMAGGLVMICYVDGRETIVQRIASQRLNEGSFIEDAATFAADQCVAAAVDGAHVALQVFDGDDGRRVFAIPFLGAPPAEWLFFG